MILKYETSCVFGTCWESISDITSYRYTKICKAQSERKDLHLNDNYRTKTKDGEIDEKNTNFGYIQVWHKRDKEPINIITNAVAYMLNDEGKTIERIN